MSRVEDLRDRILADLAEAEARVVLLRAELAEMGVTIGPRRQKNATRLAIMLVLKERGEMRPRELHRHVDVSYTALAQQLSRGTRNGLFCVRRINGDVFYSLPVPG